MLKPVDKGLASILSHFEELITLSQAPHERRRHFHFPNQHHVSSPKPKFPIVLGAMTTSKPGSPPTLYRILNA
jgi:hypothetical protein